MKKARNTVQATEPTYELHSLGWKAFQQLSVSVVSEVWGQVVQGFFDSHDGGRDGAFYGTWQSKSGELFAGSFTVQCKFSQKSDLILKQDDLKDELEKAARLADRGLSDNYILFTNMRLTGRNDEKIAKAFEEIPKIKKCVVYGSERISQFIRESPRLRMMVPRVYGLGDLSQILDQRAYDQAQEILSALGDDTAKFVITDAYRRSAQAIVEHGFVLLLGEPACGKSAIAATLSLGALDEWGCSTIKIRDADEFIKHSNPHEPKQFFWVDDAFGATRLDWQAALQWNSAFPHIRAAIRRGAKVVFTSRDYIYKNARNLLKESALPVMKEAQVVIHVEKLSKEEREQILYNHIRLGNQTISFKSEIKPYLPKIAEHQRFSPEIARRLGNSAFTKNLTISQFDLQNFVEHPVELLHEVLRTLDVESKAAIALVFIHGNLLSSPVDFSEQDKSTMALLGAPERDVRKALTALEGSLLILVRQGTQHFWRAKHPSILEAFAKLVSEDRELMDVYLAGTPIRTLFSEISCGEETPFGGEKVEVPRDRYNTVIDRVIPFYSDRKENRDAVNRFLAFRCGKEFLTLFSEKQPNFISELTVSSYFYAVSDVDVINKLFELDILPEEERIKHVQAVQELAVLVPDSGFLNRDIISFLNETEIEEIKEVVKSNLLGNLHAEVESWRDNYGSGNDPDDHFSPLKEALSDFSKAFDSDPEVQKLIEDGLNDIETAIDDLNSEIQEPDYDHGYRPSSDIASGDNARSVFDDVDS
tara:strand:- start:8468 stop:10750 length:2283 start_codon:yes stop_codon:yes gene_type:complete